MIHNGNHDVPVIAFYSVQGGVGKSTLAYESAKLISAAPGRDGGKPNVLMVDFDIDSRGLTFRTASHLAYNVSTIHEIIANRSIVNAQAIRVNDPGPDVGQLFLVPAAPADAVHTYQTQASIEPEVLLKLLKDLITSLAAAHKISCVLLDCAPGANPYTAAAATIADFPIYIGKNSDPSLDQMHDLPKKFQGWYPDFQPASQRSVINGIVSRDSFAERVQRYQIFAQIPFISDVIRGHEEGRYIESMRMTLFKKYVADIVRNIFISVPGLAHLIPKAQEVAGQEWMTALNKLEHCEQAPKMKWWGRLRYLLWLGAGLLILWLALLGGSAAVEEPPSWLPQPGTWILIAGALAIILGLVSETLRHRFLAKVRQLIYKGPDHILELLKEGQAHRQSLDRLRKLADTIPESALQVPTANDKVGARS